MGKNAPKNLERSALPEKKLIVINAFDDYRRGDAITDPEKIAEALKNHSEKVHQIASKE